MGGPIATLLVVSLACAGGCTFDPGVDAASGVDAAGTGGSGEGSDAAVPECTDEVDTNSDGICDSLGDSMVPTNGIELAWIDAATTPFGTRRRGDSGHGCGHDRRGRVGL